MGIVAGEMMTSIEISMRFIRDSYIISLVFWFENLGEKIGSIPNNYGGSYILLQAIVGRSIA